MKARWRIIVAVSAVLAAAGSPALAQEATPPAPAPTENELIGPPQLRDFSLNGTVTREAEQPEQERPATAQPSSSRPAQTDSRSSQTDRDTGSDRQRETQSEATREEGSSASVRLPPPTPAPRTTDRQIASPAAAELVDSTGFAPVVNPDPAGLSGQGIPILPWLLAALALAGAGAWYFFLRQRPRESYAGAGRANAFDASPPAPQPERRAPPARPAARPAAAPEPAVPAGIVSTRLRPWIEMEFKPGRAIVDEQKAAVQFELVVINSGSVPARDVLLEASLFNAGPIQDKQIQLFFDNPVAKGDRIPLIAPMQQVVVNTAVFLPRDQVRPIEFEGRAVFVPLIAFNALYTWARGEGQSSCSYLIGTQTKSEKLGAFRLDLGPRIFRNLAAREYELRLRK
ncbi:MAG: hypothetical protein ACLGHC_07560 [Alphaproteobacteria bacterium]